VYLVIANIYSLYISAKYTANKISANSAPNREVLASSPKAGRDISVTVSVMDVDEERNIHPTTNTHTKYDDRENANRVSIESISTVDGRGVHGNRNSMKRPHPSLSDGHRIDRNDEEKGRKKVKRVITILAVIVAIIIIAFKRKIQKRMRKNLINRNKP